jgi:hypothetical protein
MKRTTNLALAFGVTGLLLFATRGARAEEVVATRETTTVSGPNRALLHSGIWTLGLSYVPALVVAISSSESSDRSLYVPVVGPWIDYANRDCRGCAHETVNKGLLITDGIFQGIGALQLVGSFLFVETRVVAGRPSKSQLAKFQVTPARFGSGYGVAAMGSF